MNARRKKDGEEPISFWSGTESARRRVTRAKYDEHGKPLHERYNTGAQVFIVDNSDAESIVQSITSARRYALDQVQRGKRTSCGALYLAHGSGDKEEATEDVTSVRTIRWEILPDREAALAWFDDEIFTRIDEGFVFLLLRVEGQKV